MWVMRTAPGRSQRGLFRPPRADGIEGGRACEIPVSRWPFKTYGREGAFGGSGAEHLGCGVFVSVSERAPGPRGLKGFPEDR